MMRRLSRLLGIAVLVSACATTGPKFSDNPATSAAVPVDTASLIVFRPEIGGTRGAAVLLDGKEIGTVEYGAFNVFSVSPGNHWLAARIKTWSGLCDIPVDLSGGSRYFFEVFPFPTPLSPDEEVVLGFGVSLFRSLLPLVGDAVLLLGMASDEAIQSIRNKCGGFMVRQMDEATARSILDELRASR